MADPKIHRESINDSSKAEKNQAWDVRFVRRRPRETLIATDTQEGRRGPELSRGRCGEKSEGAKRRGKKSVKRGKRISWGGGPAKAGGEQMTQSSFWKKKKVK